MEEALRQLIRLTLTEDAYKRNTGKKYSAQEEMRSLVDDSGQVPPERFFTMTELNKVGVNPVSVYGTPSGVYCYPLDARHFNMLLANNLPFAGEEPNCTVLERRPGAKFLVLGDSSVTGMVSSAEEADDMAMHALEAVLPSPGSDDIETHLAAAIRKNKHRRKNPDGRLFGTLYQLCDSPTLWTRAMRSLGIDACYDPGYGIIHPNEPTQCVMLTPRAYRVIRSFNTIDIRRDTQKKISYETAIKCNKPKKMFLWLANGMIEDDDIRATIRIFFLRHYDEYNVVDANSLIKMDDHTAYIFIKSIAQSKNKKLAALVLSLPSERLEQLGLVDGGQTYHALQDLVKKDQPMSFGSDDSDV